MSDIRKAAIILIIYLLLFAGGSQAQDAKEIVRKADQRLRGESSKSELSMKIVRPDWEREISMKSWTKGEDYALILITAPARDKGTTFLLRGTEVWNYIPSIERVIKIPPSMMMQSWMGSDFTNDDLVKESSMVEDYEHEIAGDSTIDGRECWKIEMTPKPEAAVVWGKLNVWITKENYLQMRVEFFNENDELENIMKMSEIEKLGGRLLPSKMEMYPVDEEDKRTILKYKSIDFNIPIENSFFSEQNMKRVR